jgi:Uma2 family endonuclease
MKCRPGDGTRCGYNDSRIRAEADEAGDVMATAQQAKPTQPTNAVAPEQRIVLHNISWETYECLLADHENARVPRFTYDRGELEIVSPLPEHEDRRWATERLIETVIKELGIEFRNAGSTTFRRQDIERGFEPDACFYIQNEPAVRHNVVFDLHTDPPPDLVIEIDVTSSSMDKRGLYAAVGVPEIWRHANGRFTFMHIVDGEYAAGNESRVLPGVTATDVTGLIGVVGTTGRAAWLNRVSEWAESLPHP